MQNMHDKQQYDDIIIYNLKENLLNIDLKNNQPCPILQSTTTIRKQHRTINRLQTTSNKQTLLYSIITKTIDTAVHIMKAQIQHNNKIGDKNKMKTGNSNSRQEVDVPQPMLMNMAIKQQYQIYIHPKMFQTIGFHHQGTYNISIQVYSYNQAPPCQTGSKQPKKQQHSAVWTQNDKDKIYAFPILHSLQNQYYCDQVNDNAVKGQHYAHHWVDYHSMEYHTKKFDVSFNQQQFIFDESSRFILQKNVHQHIQNNSNQDSQHSQQSSNSHKNNEQFDDNQEKQMREHNDTIYVLFKLNKYTNENQQQKSKQKSQKKQKQKVGSPAQGRKIENNEDIKGMYSSQNIIKQTVQQPQISLANHHTKVETVNKILLKISTSPHAFSTSNCTYQQIVMPEQQYFGKLFYMVGQVGLGCRVRKISKNGLFSINHWAQNASKKDRQNDKKQHIINIKKSNSGLKVKQNKPINQDIIDIDKDINIDFGLNFNSKLNNIERNSVGNSLRNSLKNSQTKFSPMAASLPTNLQPNNQPRLDQVSPEKTLQILVSQLCKTFPSPCLMFKKLIKYSILQIKRINQIQQSLVKQAERSFGIASLEKNSQRGRLVPIGVKIFQEGFGGKEGKQSKTSTVSTVQHSQSSVSSNYLNGPNPAYLYAFYLNPQISIPDSNVYFSTQSLLQYYQINSQVSQPSVSQISMYSQSFQLPIPSPSPLQKNDCFSQFSLSPTQSLYYEIWKDHLKLQNLLHSKWKNIMLMLSLKKWNSQYFHNSLLAMRQQFMHIAEKRIHGYLGVFADTKQQKGRNKDESTLKNVNKQLPLSKQKNSKINQVRIQEQEWIQIKQKQNSGIAQLQYPSVPISSLVSCAQTHYRPTLKYHTYIHEQLPQLLVKKSTPLSSSLSLSSIPAFSSNKIGSSLSLSMFSPSLMLTTSPENILFILVHGFNGNQYDMNRLKSFISYYCSPHFLVLKNISAKMMESLDEIGKLAAEEIGEFLKTRPFIKRVNFIGFSLGGVVIRAALPHLKPFAKLFNLLITLSSPHLGVKQIQNCIVKTGLNILNKVRGAKNIKQLMLDPSSHPSPSPSQSPSPSSQQQANPYLSTLSLTTHLSSFPLCIFIGSHEDKYVPGYSSTLTYQGNNPVILQMQQNIKNNVRQLHQIYVKFDEKKKGGIWDRFSGRRVHINFLDDDGFIWALFGHYYWRF